MNIGAPRSVVSASSTLSSSTTPFLILVQRVKHGRAVGRSLDEQGIIIGSTLGSIVLILLCLAIILYPIWRRRHKPSRVTPKRTPSRLSKSCPSPMPRTSDIVDLHMVRPVTPSPRRLAIDASVPSSAHPFDTISMRWDLEKASVHTPSGHPAILWRGNIFGKESPVASGPDDHSQAQQSEPSISTTFAAEMSSLLESISIKSSYSSLRSSGAVLGVPARLQTPLSVQKLRQDSCTTSVGAARGSVSDGGVGPSSVSRVPSTSSHKDSGSKVGEK